LENEVLPKVMAILKKAQPIEGASRADHLEKGSAPARADMGRQRAPAVLAKPEAPKAPFSSRAELVLSPCFPLQGLCGASLS